MYLSPSDCKVTDFFWKGKYLDEYYKAGKSLFDWYFLTKKRISTSCFNEGWIPLLHRFMLVLLKNQHKSRASSEWNVAFIRSTVSSQKGCSDYLFWVIRLQVVNMFYADKCQLLTGLMGLETPNKLRHLIYIFILTWKYFELNCFSFSLHQTDKI